MTLYEKAANKNQLHNNLQIKMNGLSHNHQLITPRKPATTIIESLPTPPPPTGKPTTAAISKLKSINKHSFMANRCCVCACLLRNWRGHKLAKYYDINVDLNADELQQHQYRPSSDGHSSNNGDSYANNSKLVNNKKGTTTKTTRSQSNSSSRIFRLISKHLIDESISSSQSVQSYMNMLNTNSNGSSSISKKVCQSCYEHVNQIDSHMRSALRLRNMMKHKLRKSFKLAVAARNRCDDVFRKRCVLRSTVGCSATTAVTQQQRLKRKLEMGADENNNSFATSKATRNGFVTGDSVIKRENNNFIGGHKNNIGGGKLISSSTASSMSSSPSLSPVYASNHYGGQNGASFYRQHQNEQYDHNGMEIKPPLSPSSNRRKRKSQNPSRLLNKGLADPPETTINNNNNNSSGQQSIHPPTNIKTKLQTAVSSSISLNKTTATRNNNHPNHHHQVNNNSEKVQLNHQRTLNHNSDNSKLLNKLSKNSILAAATLAAAAAAAASSSVASTSSGASSSNAASASTSQENLKQHGNNSIHHSKPSPAAPSNHTNLAVFNSSKENDNHSQQVKAANGNKATSHRKNLASHLAQQEDLDGVQENENNNDNDDDDDEEDEDAIANNNDEEIDEIEQDEYDENIVEDMDNLDDEVELNNNNNHQGDEGDYNETGGMYDEDEEVDENGGGGSLVRGSCADEDEDIDYEVGDEVSSGNLAAGGGGRHHALAGAVNGVLGGKAYNLAAVAVAGRVSGQQTRQTQKAGKKFATSAAQRRQYDENSELDSANMLLSISGGGNSRCSGAESTNGDFKHNCTICRKSFKTQNILRQHMRIHTGDKPFVCDLCNKPFSQMASLKYHQATHSDDRPFKCDGCSKTFKLKPPYKKHINQCPQRIALLESNPNFRASSAGGGPSTSASTAFLNLLNTSGLTNNLEDDEDDDDNEY